MNGNNIQAASGSPRPRRVEAGKQQPAGFTLLEIVVVMAIFSVLIVIIIDVFLMALTAQRQASQRQKVLANLRYITETVARQVRTSEICYDHYATGLAVPEDELALKDIEGDIFVYGDSGGEMTLSTNYQDPVALTNLEEIQVTKLLFYINPLTNPFYEEKCDGGGGCQATIECTIDDSDNEFKAGYCLCNKSDELQDCATKNCVDDEALDAGICLPFNYQPRVTMVLGFQSMGVKPEEQKTIYLQTTVSSRVYKR